MANRYWVGGTASWDGTAGTKWATTSGGAGGSAIPTSVDDVFFDAASGANTVTIASGHTNCKALNCTGFTGTLAGSQALSVYGSLTLVPGMTYSYTGAMTFSGTSSFGVTSGGLTMDHNVTFNGVGGTWTLGDNCTWGSTRTATLTRGTLALSSYTMKAGLFSTSTTTTRVVAFGTGTLELTGAGTVWNSTSQGALSITGASTGAILVSGATAAARAMNMATSFIVTLPSVTVSAGSGTLSLSQCNFTDYTQTSGYTGVMTISGGLGLKLYGSLSLDAANGTPGAGTTVTFAATSGTKTISTGGLTCDFPFRFAGIGGTFQLSANVTSGATRLLTVDGGTLDLNGFTFSIGFFTSTTTSTRGLTFGSGTIDLTNTTGSTTVFNIASATGITVTPGTGTIIVSGARSSTRSISTASTTIALPSIIISGGSGSLSFANVNCLNLTFTSGYTNTGSMPSTTLRGNLVIPASGPTFTGGGPLVFTATSGTQTVTTNGKTLNSLMILRGSGGTVQLVDTLTLGSSAYLVVEQGTFDANNQDVVANSVVSTDTTYARAITLGSGTWTLSAAGAAWNVAAANLTVTAGTSTIKLTSVNARFSSTGTSLTYYDLWFSSTGGVLEVYGSNTFHDIKAAGPSTLKFESGTTTHVTTWNVNGTAGNLVTLQSSTAALHYLVADGAALTGDYLDISYSSASPEAKWFAGTNSIDSGSNVGWFLGFAYFSGVWTEVALGGLDAAVLAAGSGDVLILAPGDHTLTEDVPPGVTLRSSSCSSLTSITCTNITPLGENTFRDLTFYSAANAFNPSSDCWFENCVFSGTKSYANGPDAGQVLTFNRCTFLGVRPTGEYPDDSTFGWSDGDGLGFVRFLSCLFRDEGAVTYCFMSSDLLGIPDAFQFENCTFVLENALSMATNMDGFGAPVYFNDNIIYQPGRTDIVGSVGDASDGIVGAGNFYQDDSSIANVTSYLTQSKDLDLDVQTGALRNGSPARSAATQTSQLLDRNYLPYGASGSRSSGCFQWQADRSAFYRPWYLDPVDGFTFAYEPGVYPPTISTSGKTSGVTEVRSNHEAACLVRKWVHDLTHPLNGDFYTSHLGAYTLVVRGFTFDLTVVSPASRIFGPQTVVGNTVY